MAGAWLAVMLAGSLLYCFTAQRGVGWQDSGAFQWRALVGDLRGPTLAMSHPLYVGAGRYILKPLVGERSLPQAMNMFSGAGMAVALANLAAAVTVATGRRWVGAGTAAMLAVCHTAWWLSTISEAGYTWSAAGLTLELWLMLLLLRRPRWQTLSALALVNGIGLCVHNVAVLPLPVYLAVAVLLVRKKSLPGWSLAAAAAAWLAGAGLYLGMIVELAAREGSMVAAVNSALFGRFASHVLNLSSQSRFFKANAILGAMNFVNFLLPLALIGWARFRRSLGGPGAWAFAAITVIQFLFVVRYPIQDQFTYFLPTLVMIAFASGVGLSAMVDAGGWRRGLGAAFCVASIILPPAFYAAAPRVAGSLGIQAPRIRVYPFREGLRYWLVPWKHNEDSAQRYALRALEEAGRDNGIILPDYTSLYPPMIARRIYGAGDGVSIMKWGELLPGGGGLEALKKASGGRSIYVVNEATVYLPEGIRDAVTLERKEGDILYRLKGRREKTNNQ